MTDAPDKPAGNPDKGKDEDARDRNRGVSHGPGGNPDKGTDEPAPDQTLPGDLPLDATPDVEPTEVDVDVPPGGSVHIKGGPDADAEPDEG